MRAQQHESRRSRAGNEHGRFAADLVRQIASDGSRAQAARAVGPERETDDRSLITTGRQIDDQERNHEGPEAVHERAAEKDPILRGQRPEILKQRRGMLFLHRRHLNSPQVALVLQGLFQNGMIMQPQHGKVDSLLGGIPDTIFNAHSRNRSDT